LKQQATYFTAAFAIIAKAAVIFTSFPFTCFATRAYTTRDTQPLFEVFAITGAVS
jgi:hypothetical protein